MDEIDDVLQQLQIRIETRYGKPNTEFFTVTVLGIDYETHPVIDDLFQYMESGHYAVKLAVKYPSFARILARIFYERNRRLFNNLKRENNRTITFEIGA